LSEDIISLPICEYAFEEISMECESDSTGIESMNSVAEEVDPTD
jgi:hypothetical protein